jgi:hypothetical protein
MLRSQNWSDKIMERRGEKIVASPIEARQGLLGRPVLLVLVISCVLAVAALALTYAGVFGHT